MGFLDTIKSAITGEEQQEKTMLDTVNDACSLTWKQRIIGFACCCGAGIILSILSIPILWTLNVTQFAIMYSLGSILSICSTMFLMGPVKQCKRMFESHRAIATAVYLGAIVGTLILAFKTGNAGLCIIMLVIQFIALAWYCITWIPGGMTAVKAMIGIGS